VEKTFDIPALPGYEDAGIAYGGGSVWVAEWVAACCGAVFRLDSRTGAVEQTVRTGAPGPLLAENGRIWLALEDLVLIDAKKNLVAGSIHLGARPRAVAVGSGSLWAAVEDGRVVRISPQSGRVVQTIRVGGTPSGLAVDRDTVWVAIA
jgi:DNA-binding beta-propeller fold protein YncE